MILGEKARERSRLRWKVSQLFAGSSNSLIPEPSPEETSMNVCMIVLKDYYTDPRVRRYAESLADSGVDVDVLCLKSLRSAPQTVHDKVKTFAIPLQCLTDRSLNYFLSYLIAFVWFSFWLFFLYVKKRYSVIHVHNMPDFLVFAAFLPRLLGAKVILDIHDPMPEFYQSKFGRNINSFGVKIFKFQERLSAVFAHSVITANVYFKANLVARGIPEAKITVINNIADSRWFNRNQYKNESHQAREYFTLIYPGTIASRYGVDIAIRALPLLTGKLPIRLRVIGLGPQVGELSALAEHLGVSSFLELKPFIPVNQVAREISQADVGIYPALPDAHMNIATPTKVLEYAMMGIPVIASRLKVLEDMFGETAIQFFQPGSVEQFAACVLDLYHNPARRVELVNNADKAFVKSHSWVNEYESYSNTLHDLLRPQKKIKTRKMSNYFHVILLNSIRHVDIWDQTEKVFR